MNRNKLLIRQVAGNGILSYTFSKFDVKPDPLPVATAVLCAAVVVAFYALLIIQFLYQPYA